LAIFEFGVADWTDALGDSQFTSSPIALQNAYVEVNVIPTVIPLKPLPSDCLAALPTLTTTLEKLESE